MRDPERWKPVFIFIVTTLILSVFSAWLAWVHDAERWGLLAGAYVVLLFIVWRFWDYRPPD